MAITADALKAKLMKSLDAETVEIQDISPEMCGTSFSAVVVSPQFVGKSRLQQQRMVNKTLEEEMKSIHAFTLKTYTPEKWKAESGDA